MGRNLFADNTEEETGAVSTGRDLFGNGQPKSGSPTATYNNIKAKMPEGSWYDEIIEPLQQIGAGMAGQVAGGWAGIAELATGGSMKRAGERVREVSEDIANWGAPETQRGADATNKVMNRVQALTEIARGPVAGPIMAGERALTGSDETGRRILEQGVGPTMGQAVMDVTGSPAAATLTELGPMAAGTALGMKYPPTRVPSIHDRARMPVPVEGGIKQTPIRQGIEAIRHPMQALDRRSQKAAEESFRIRRALEQGAPDERSAGWRLLEDGTVIEDPILKRLVAEAERQGFRRPQLTAVQNASNADKEAMKGMLEIKKYMMRTGDYAGHRPSDIPGAVVMREYEHLKTLRRQSGERLDDVARNLKGELVDFDPAIQQLKSDLYEKFGVMLDQNNTPIIKGSMVEGLPEMVKIIEELVDRLKAGNRAQGQGFVLDAYDVHRMKRWIDNRVDYGKQIGGMTGQLEVVMKGLRRRLNDSLRNRFNDYDVVNTQYSDAVGAINDLKSISRSMDFDGTYAESNMGQLMRRLLSNQVSRNRLASAIDDIHRVHMKYGGESLHNPRSLMVFADELDSALGDSAPYSFMGQVTEGGKLAAEAALGGRGQARALGELAGGAVQASRGINPDNAVRSLENLLDYRPPTR